jgi:hypothetical protein
VIGRTREVKRSVATTVLTSAPGVCITQREKIPRNASSRYCPSYIDQRCDCNARIVWVGEKEVCKVVIEDAGDCRFRSLDLSRRRNLWGTRSCIDRHGICMWIVENLPCCLSFQDGKVVDMIAAAWGEGVKLRVKVKAKVSWSAGCRHGRAGRLAGHGGGSDVGGRKQDWRERRG